MIIIEQISSDFYLNAKTRNLKMDGEYWIWCGWETIHYKHHANLSKVKIDREEVLTQSNLFDLIKRLHYVYPESEIVAIPAYGFRWGGKKDYCYGFWRRKRNY